LLFLDPHGPPRDGFAFVTPCFNRCLAGCSFRGGPNNMRHHGRILRSGALILYVKHFFRPLKQWLSNPTVLGVLPWICLRPSRSITEAPPPLRRIGRLLYHPLSPRASAFDICLSLLSSAKLIGFLKFGHWISRILFFLFHSLMAILQLWCPLLPEIPVVHSFS